jgi:CHAT domain-containing protein
MRIILRKSILYKSFLLIYLLCISIANVHAVGSNQLKTAVDLFNEAKYGKSQELLLEFLQKVELNDESKDVFTARLFLARIYTSSRKYKLTDSLILIMEDQIKNEFPSDHIANADLNYLKGLKLLLQLENKNAEKYLSLAVNEKERNIEKRSETSILDCYNSYGYVLTNLNKQDSAILYCNRAIKHGVDDLKLSRNDKRLGRLYSTIGIAYSESGNYQLALKFLRQKLQMLKETNGSNSQFGKVYNNLGKAMLNKEKNDSALTYFFKSVDCYTKANRQYNVLSVYMNIGAVYLKTSDNVNALLFFERAYNIIKERGWNLGEFERKIAMNIGYTYQSVLEYEKAIDYYNLSLNEKDSHYLKSLRNLANCYTEMEDYGQAEKYYLKSIDFADKNKKSDPGELALLYVRYVNFLITYKNDERSASKYVKLATRYNNLSSKKSKRDQALILYYIGDYFGEINQYEKSLEYYKKAVNVINGKVEGFYDYFNPPKVSDLEVDNIQMTIIGRIAFRLFALYQHTDEVRYLYASYEHLKLYVDYVSNVQETLSSEEGKLFLTDNTNKHFDRGVEVSNMLYDITDEEKYLKEAFEFAEKSKSSVLLAAIKDVEAMKVSKIDTSLQNEYHRLNKEMANLDRLIHDEEQKIEPKKVKINNWQKLFFQKKDEYRDLTKRLKIEAPQYYDLKIRNEIVSVDKVREEIKENEVLIEYLLTDTTVYSFIITKDSTLIHAKQFDSDVFEYSIEEIRDCLTANEFSNYSPEDYKRFIGASYYLYQLLIQSHESILEDKKLIIVPDGILGYIPFEILVTKYGDPTKFNYKNLEYLIYNHPISYSYSSTLLYRKFDKGETNDKVLAFAPSYDNKEIVFKDKSDIEQKLFPITGVTEEVQYIGEHYENDIFLNEQATESQFKEKAEHYKVLHLAMHTLIDDENPLYSNLVFAADTSNGEDGSLNAYELFGMDLRADMAVLSACNTGFGKLHGGEGIMSLARGFLYAGVNSIIMTLWAVEDHSSASLMQLFYDFLAEGYEKDKAMQLAKIKYLEGTHKLGAHPHYWAGYVCIGETDSIEVSVDYVAWAALILLLISPVVLFMIYKKGRAKFLDQMSNKLEE